MKINGVEYLTKQQVTWKLHTSGAFMALQVKEDINAGRFNIDGPQPVQPDGGLKSFGYPIGASGLRMMYEIYKQLHGKAQLPERQFKNPKLGLTHNLGGFPAMNVVSPFIAGL